MEQQNQILRKKTILVYSTDGTPIQEISTTAQLWKELKVELSEKGINYSDKIAMIGENKLELSIDDAIIPDSDFTLFLMPKKTKSGMTTSKKSPAKKAATKKSTTATKKAAPKKAVAEKSDSSTSEKIATAAKKTQKELTDLDKVTQSIQLLGSVTDPTVSGKLQRTIVELGDIEYTLTTGKPRIDKRNLEAMAKELANQHPNARK